MTMLCFFTQHDRRARLVRAHLVHFLNALLVVDQFHVDVTLMSLHQTFENLAKTEFFINLCTFGSYSLSANPRAFG